ncbi:MAG: sugar phosphate isomerase/epimerase family protein [Thermoproteota archaeon]
MYVGCSCLVCSKRKYPTLREALRKIKELGFGAFDLDAFEGWQRINPSELPSVSEAWVRRFVEEVQSSGLKASSFNCSPSKELTDPDDGAFERYKAEFLALLELAEKVGCPNITLQPGAFAEGSRPEEILETLSARLLELCELKEGYSASVSLEGHANTAIENPKLALDLVSGLWPLVGFTYDPSHFVMKSIALPETEKLLDYTLHVHVRNASFGKMQDEVARGEVDFKWLVKALRSRGYGGALAIEYFDDFDSDFSNVLELRELLVKLGASALPPRIGLA